MKLEQTCGFQTVKETISKAYELVPEAYRKKFKNFEKETDKTRVEFARKREHPFDRWCMSEKLAQISTFFKEMILLEEFHNCVHPPIKNHITEQKAQTLQKVPFSLTNIFFRRVPMVPLLKEIFKTRKILLVLIILHQM